MCTFHDANWRHFDTYSAAQKAAADRQTAAWVQRADRFVCSSRFIRGELTHLFAADPARITVVPLTAEADPRPVTDAELAAYAASNNGAMAAAGDWVADNWEYLAGGAMVIAGGVLIATGVGGPAGMMLISAGADTIIQKATTGGVNWGQVAISGAFGAWGGAAAAARMGVTGAARQAVVGGVVADGTSGAVQGGYGYATSGQPLTPTGLLRATASGAAVDAATGGLMSSGPSLLVGNQGRLLDDVPATPQQEAPVSIVRSSGTSASRSSAGLPMSCPCCWHGA